MSTIYRIAVLTLLAAGLRCASTDLNHMALTNYADRTVTPDEPVLQWIATPLLIPLCVGTLAVDNFVVAPAVQLPSAFENAADFFTYDIDGYYSRMGILPFQTALTPVIFAGSWILRTAFAVEPHKDAAWAWPEWGRQWRRDESGRLIGPPEERSDVDESDSPLSPEKVEAPAGAEVSE